MAKSTVDQNEYKEIRHGFGEGLLEVARENKNVIALSADLSESIGFNKVAEALPNQYVEVGIAEQNLICVASGLAHMGKIPFAGSYSIFNPGRNWEQIRTTVCLNAQNVKIISTHAGFSDATDGATHQALEDIALTRVLPNLIVLSPADYNEAKAMAHALVKDKRPTYVRIMRGKFPLIFPDTINFHIGSARQLRSGKDIAIFSTGSMLANVLDSAEVLASKGISASIYHFPTIKPLDTTVILFAAHKYKNIVTVEEHQISAGFGSSVLEVLAETPAAKVLRIGAQDSFGESGVYEELLHKHGLDAKSMAKSIQKFLRK